MSTQPPKQTTPSNGPAAGKLAIAARGKFRVRLELRPTQSTEKCRRAADELTHYLERAVGDTLPLEPDDANAPHALRMVLDPTLETHREAFVWSVDTRSAELLAKTPAGLEHGVHWFLERFAGLRWLWPGDSGEVLPLSPTLEIPAGEWHESPDFDWRRIGVGGSLLERYDYHWANRAFLKLDSSCRTDFERWAWRNRLGGLEIADGHLLNELLPAEILGKDHPEYFALVDGQRAAKFHNGKHNNQPCTSNDDAIDHIAEGAIARFSNNPTLDAISISMNDGWQICECETCRSLDPEDAVQAAVDTGPMAADAPPPTVCHVDGTARVGHSVTDRLFIYANAAWNRIAEKRPDKLLVMLIYAACRKPPIRTRLADRVIAQFCTMCNRYSDEAWRQRELEDLNKLSAYVSRIGIYEYYEQGAWPGITRLFPKLITRSIQDFYRAGARYFATQPGYGFATNGLNFFTLSRVLWDTAVDADQVIDDFCITAFGPLASPAMKNYFEAFEQRWVESNAMKSTSPRRALLGLGELYTESFMDARERDLDQAHTRCSHVGERDRVAFFAKGFEFTREVVRAFDATARLQDSLDDDLWSDDFIDHASTPPTPDQRDLLQNAIKSWRSVESLAERNKGQFVYSEFWFNYMPHLCDWPRSNYWLGPLLNLRRHWGACPPDIAVDTPVTKRRQADQLR